MNITNVSHFTRKSLFFMYFLLISLSSYAQLPNGFTDSKSQGGYTSPMGVIFSKNGQKMFVWEKSGKLWVSNWNGSSYVKQSSPALDISDEVGDWRDLGFHSVALDPNFDSNGLIYLFYQVDRHHLINFGTPQYSKTTDAYFEASISRVTRYKLNNDVADNASRKILIGESKTTGIPLLFNSHSGGQIIFGADGTLLVTTGDNANATGFDVGNSSGTYFQQAIDDGIIRTTENVGAMRAQMINSFCGKLLRIDPNTGDGVSSNPYYDAGTPRSAKSRVWALGLRNPYRISFKTGTGSSNPSAGNPGTIFVADVQNGSWEELHILEKGGLNCGWPIFEGLEDGGGYFTESANVRNQEESGSPTFRSLCVSPTSATVNSTISQRRFTHFPPTLDWSHSENLARYPDFRSGALVPTTIGSSGSQVAGTPFQGNAATSGTYYTGTAFPTAFQNVYFFADYGANWIKAAVVRDSSHPQITEIKSFAPDGYGKGIVDIEYCPLDGSIFYVNINTGDIQKISYGGGNRPPVAAISADKTSGTSPLTVNFSSSGSGDPDGSISYDWNFGDGSSNSTSANPSHTFTSTGTKGFTVKLTVKDDQGLTDSKTIVISVNNGTPSVKITNPTNTTKYTLTGTTPYSLKATVTDNDPSGMQYAWQVTLRHNNHEHREPIVTQQSPTVQISPVGCDGDTYYYLIEVKVTDNGGLTARDSVKIFPDCNSLPPPTPTPTQKLGCLKASYFNNITLTGTPLVRAESSINYNWGTSSPVNGIDADNFSVRWEGTVIPSVSGTYTFNVLGDDGVRLWVNNQLIVDKWFYQAAANYAATINLTQGQNIAIKLEYFERVGGASAKLLWTVPNQSSKVIAFNACPVSTPPPTPTPVSNFNPNKCYRFLARQSGKVMEIASSSTANGAKAQQNTWNGAKNQVWRIKTIDGTYHRILNGNSGKALDVKAESTADGAFLQQYNYNSGANQQFKFEATGSFYFVSARHSSKYLEVSGNSVSNGAAIVQMPKKGSTNQQWQVTETTCPTGTALLISQIYSAEGYREGRKSIVTWISNAADADYFMVEKLDKNGDFETLDLVNAKPLTVDSDKNYYSFIDNQTLDGENTYRITLVEPDMPPQYSNLITLNFKAIQDFAVFPNPSSDYVNVDLSPYEDRLVQLTIIDAVGREVRSASVEKAGKIHHVELTDLPNGQYIIRIHTLGKRDVTRLFTITK